MQTKPYLIILIIVATAMVRGLCGCSPKVSENNKEAMSQGELLYRGNCASCHSLLAPEEHDGPTWEAYIEKYGNNLSAEEKKLVYNFLTGQEEPSVPSPP